MKIAIWKTGHSIADTVADALKEGFDGKVQSVSEIHSGRFDGEAINIAYGILRGTEAVFKQSRHWFNVDRGYFNPSHFDGYYRISYKGTQARWHEGIPRKPIDIKLEPWREYNSKKPILICPPSDYVRQFFGVPDDWVLRAISSLPSGSDIAIRNKGVIDPINWDNYGAVVTFNSSVGWQALQRGIPVLSDPEHSIVGSFYKSHPTLQSLIEKLPKMQDNRVQLFEAMAAHQFTLAEIRAGKAWELIKHYTLLSDGMTGNQSQQRSLPTPSNAALKHHFQSNS